MKFLVRLVAMLAMALVLVAIWRLSLRGLRQPADAGLKSGTVLVARAAAHDVSRPLVLMRASETPAQLPDCAVRAEGCGMSPADPDDAESDRVIAGDWPSANALIVRVSALHGSAAAAYKGLLEKLNGNEVAVTPSSPAGCGKF